ncbi:phospholipid phosphatase-related protein type 3 isoform X2 [Takifugu rubripes]|uniref:phospholipid phosphatase-related protein type 3 isoform X2 n=1 Tax=Takifugu rubripes TaxID=31033 RepID=UPI001145E460|nr:phospholipid phosphatase-related protein type 3 isoform X2 [Takifugu rubripes]XP_029684019.1 phospholipid phosphatase-related protein type 3 isoform X2 [Takifugu rubripes]XP_029684020.1 phospholipid phosphatase-related protein type 3 isoform X2 [Takifugu rubripes]
MMMISSSKMMKSEPSEHSLTLLPCFYFVEIMLVEGLTYCLRYRLKLRPPTGSVTAASGCGFNSFLRRTVHFVGVHVFGLCATALVTDIIQLSTGHHAPFFLTVCKPNYTLAGASCDSNAYITKDICSGHDQHAIMAARKSFPSQHATLSAFAAVFVSIYLDASISDSTKLLKPVLVFAFAIAAVLTGLTQITQHRSHPADVYVGFLIGALIAVYLARHAVANFKSSDDVVLAPPSPLVKEDPLRALTERGHESVYHKGPPSAAGSSEEIAGAPAHRDQLEVLGPLHREEDSVESLKRASLDVELLAPRSPMAKETMLTFSNTLPRANAAVGGADAPPGELARPSQPAQRRLRVVQVPLEPFEPQQLLPDWKRKPAKAPEHSDGWESVETDKGGSPTPTFQPSAQFRGAPSNCNKAAPHGGAKAVATPRPPQLPEAGPPPVSPKSALTRAKWLQIREKTQGTAEPRLVQVVAVAKLEGRLSSQSSGENPEPTPSRYELRKGWGDAQGPHHPAGHPQQSALIPVPTGIPRESVGACRRGGSSLKGPHPN